MSGLDWIPLRLLRLLEHLRCQKEGEDVFGSRPLWSIFSARSFNLVQGSINQRHQGEEGTLGPNYLVVFIVLVIEFQVGGRATKVEITQIMANAPNTTNLEYYIHFLLSY